MRSPLRSACAGLLICLCLASYAFASAYNARPRLVVVVVIDQFRGDYLERYRDQFGEGGFRLFLDHGAYFTDCNYHYANTRTAPGHATLLTGAYSNGHGILANEWWDPRKKRMVTSVQDDATKIVGVDAAGPGSSPRNLLSSTLGDELKLATQGKARVFGISLKDRAAVLPAGMAADGAYWIDPKTGAWVTSSYYRGELPRWVADFNAGKPAEKYWNREWKDSAGKTLRSTGPSAQDSSAASFYDAVGSTPFANDYELEFARELVTDEKLGNGPATDLLIISLSANDILGHQVGSDAPEMHAMAVALDRQLAGFFTFLGHQFGLANVWIALSADHGVAPLPSVAAKFRLPAANLNADQMRQQLNAALSARFSPGRPSEYVKAFDYPLAWLDEDSFAPLKIKQADAEHAAGEALQQLGLRGYFTRSQLAQGAVPDTDLGHKYANSYSPHSGWYVMAVPVPYTVGVPEGTDHASPYTYDAHVPLAFYGLPFQPGVFRTHAEPVDLAVTLASLLGINAPTHAIGRVLTEALSSLRPQGASHAPGMESPGSPEPAPVVQPAALATGGAQ